MTTVTIKRRTIYACAGFAISALGPNAARASDITFAVIGPHEYDLPVDFKPFNVFVQYGDGNAAGNTYDGQGSRRGTGGSHTWVGLSKYVHFRSFEAIPKVGFAFELIQAESFTLANGTNYGGLGTTIPGFASWFKPNSHSTFGFQTFMQSPSGTRDATASHYWSNISSFLFDYEWKHFSFDGDLGAVTSVTSRHLKNQNSYTPGTSFFTNLRFSWKATKLLEPFFAFDWQNVAGIYDKTQKMYVSDSSSREVAGGMGVMLNLSKSVSLTMRYSHSIEGRNVPETNAYYMKFVYLW
ncbi:transporter [Acetobacter sacchari]|uniref:Transporter n=1 Tax=Acetobacter sacchari TaxID=2661687 RepID=A0ABS3LW71_9PROT|nr:transporter [Acetobacter sacchari]MBO1360149.1 transporter [Acetobacter sacchari]